MRNWIWGRKTKLSKFAYNTLKSISRFEVPIIPGLHHFLFYLRKIWAALLVPAFNKFYSEPIFRMQCRSVGKSFLLYEEMPKLLGNLEIEIGNGVTLSGGQVWIAGGPGSTRRISIGDGSYLGHSVNVVSGSVVAVGKHVLVANRVVINGYDGHPLDPLARARNEPPGPNGHGDIVLEDYCWIGNDSTILKNVRIGKGAIVAAGSVVTSDVPDLVIVAGVPAKPIGRVPTPEHWT